MNLQDKRKHGLKEDIIKDTLSNYNDIVNIKSAIDHLIKHIEWCEVAFVRIEEAKEYSHFTDCARRLNIPNNVFFGFIKSGIENEIAEAKTKLDDKYISLRAKINLAE